MSCDLEFFSRKYEECVIPLDITSKIAHDVLNGLAFIHETGFIHTDLKPENILVDEITDKYVISDLGTAVVIGDREFNYLQTSHYRSPDIILNHKNWNEKIDIWSFGCIIYECITGGYLFKGETEEDYITSFIETIGIPPDNYLVNCKEKRKFFNRDDKFKNAADLEPMCIDRILTDKHGFDLKTANSIYTLVQPMFIWDIDKRWSATDLLRLYSI